MKFRLILTALLVFIMVSVASTSTSSAGLIVNGGFEAGGYSPTQPGADYMTLNAGSTALTGWQIGGSGVDWVGTYWQASQGTKSIDLSSTGIGWISQTIATTANTAYRLSFDMAGNPEGGSGVSKIKNMLVTLGGASGAFQMYTFDTTGKTKTDMGWLPLTLSFVAQGPSTTLTFMSLEPGAYGPAIDNVDVATVPIPPAAWLLGSGLLGLVAIRRKRTK